MYNNKRLFDVLTRHQIYVEGVKAKYAKDFNSVLRQLDKEIRELFLRLRFNSLDSLTKALLRDFLGELRDIQYNIYSAYTERIVNQIKTFMQADVEVSKILFATMYEESLVADDEIVDPVSEDEADAILEDDSEEKGLFPVSWYTDETNDGLWGYIKNAPIPANGILVMPFIEGFVSAASMSIENIVRKGYANRAKVNDVIDEITGTKSKNFRDGAFNKIKQQSEAVTSTSVQHITSIAQAGIASLFFEHYRWVSIIDNVTTVICRGRNNKIYVFGVGPLPPAHIRCRSKIIPWIVGEQAVVPTYYAWMKSQPNSIQNDVLGYDKALKLREGKIKAIDMQDFDNENSISEDEFVDKIDNMLTR